MSTPTPSERLSDDEMAYHAALISQVRAFQALQGAPAAWEFWRRHLIAKYGPAIEIDENGTIRRAASSPSQGG